jgi:glycosyltransferase involved in cell wall biosynthesis
MENKILIFMPTINVGGVEKNFFLITNYLSKKYNHLSVVSLSREIKKKLNKKIKFVGPKTKIFEKYSRRIKFLISLIYLIKNIILNRDTLVLCFQANMYCVFICKLFGAKVVLRSNSSPEGWSKNIIKLQLYKLGFKCADGIIVNSQQFKKQLKKKFNVQAKCIYNPLNYNEVKRLSKKKVKFSFYNKKSLNIINVARFEDQKDHLTLLKAINILKKKINFRLVLIGNGSNEPLIREYIKNYKLQKEIKIIKNITNPFPYILKSDLVVLTSIYEGLPNILLESLVLNKFIISSRCPTGPAEILDNGKGGLLFKVKNFKELSEKILFYKKNKSNLKIKLIHAKKNLHKFDYIKNLAKYSNYLNRYIN